MSIIFRPIWPMFFLALIVPCAALATDEDRPSLWDVVDGGMLAPQSAEARAASRELTEARYLERQVVDAGEYSEPTPVLPVDINVGDEGLVEEEVEPVSNSLDLSRYDIPVELNEAVERWLNYFKGNGHDFFSRWLERRAAWEPMIEEVMEAHGLPDDLVSVAMIESGFSNLARSHASAVGMWQFIAPTARGYGLVVDYWIDERRDPELATAAAARYFIDLQRMFDNWYLSWAAYNSGPGTVRSAIRRGESQDYWELSRQRLLPPETRNYVPKIIAATIIAQNPEEHGFELGPLHEPWSYDEIEVEGSVSLDVIATCAGVHIDELTVLNPSLLRAATPPSATTSVRLPEGTQEQFSRVFAEIPESERLTYKRHTVASGEALGVIAQRYSTTINDIVRFNGLDNPNQIRVGLELVIPVPVGAPEVLPPTVVPTRPLIVEVRAGQNLTLIAREHGTTRDQIIDWNSLTDPDRLSVGQELIVGEISAPINYTVRSGDTLSGIASEHDVSTNDLKNWNGLDSNTIHPGQELIVSAPQTGE